MASSRRISGGCGEFTGVWTRCATPTRCWGFPKSANEAEIKSAFRRLAKKLHPDANKHDPKAASRFAELNAAYEIVGDGDKRKAFDRGEIDAEGKPRFQGFEGYGAQPGGGAHGPGGAHFESFSLGPDGFRRRAPVRAPAPGVGRASRIFCAGCSAAARAPAADRHAVRNGRFRRPRRGAGPARLADDHARRRGQGHKDCVHLPTGKDVDVKIPAGLADGQTIRLKGQGWPSATAGQATR